MDAACGKRALVASPRVVRDYRPLPAGGWRKLLMRRRMTLRKCLGSSTSNPFCRRSSAPIVPTEFPKSMRSYGGEESGQPFRVVCRKAARPNRAGFLPRPFGMFRKPMSILVPRVVNCYGLGDRILAMSFILWEVAEIVIDLPDVRVSCDSDNDKFLATAVGGRAEYHVTGDVGDLLHLREYTGVAIVSPRDFVSRLKTRHDRGREAAGVLLRLARMVASRRRMSGSNKETGSLISPMIAHSPQIMYGFTANCRD